MNNNMGVFKFLDDIQHQIDGEHEKFVKRDFECKLEHHNLIKPVLKKRDEHVSGGPGMCENYWSRAFLNYDVSMEILPTDDENNVVARWIKHLEVDYVDGYMFVVHIELNENEFVHNTFLTKRMYLDGREIEKTEIRWKNAGRYPIFAFFESDVEDFDVFDILYEIYVNSAYYFLLSK